MQNPTLYWSSLDFNEILVVEYYLENKTYKALKFRFPSSNHYVIPVFQKNNLFYILMKNISEEALTIYAFKNGSLKKKHLIFQGPYSKIKTHKKQDLIKLLKPIQLKK